MREAEAVGYIEKLERDDITKVLDALEAKGHDEEALEAWAVLIDDALHQPEEGLDSIRALRDGDAVADMIISVKSLHELTSPAAAGGWRKAARWTLFGVLGVTGASLATGQAFPFGSLFVAAIGVAAATVINWHFLGGRPERRHAVGELLSPKSQRRWKAVREAAGPSPATISLQRLESEAISIRGG